ncbi:MAG: biotin/lipoyl-containing protein, partial [Caldilinea sp.]
MATPVIMPKFGMAQEEGTIIRWLKQAGEWVEKGETILEVQTDKIDMEVEAPASGVLTDVRYGADATVPVTTVIA